jgi:hypothetical protein
MLERQNPAKYHHMHKMGKLSRVRMRSEEEKRATAPQGLLLQQAVVVDNLAHICSA